MMKRITKSFSSPFLIFLGVLIFASGFPFATTPSTFLDLDIGGAAHAQGTQQPSPIVLPDDAVFSPANPTSGEDFAEGAVSQTALDPTNCDTWYKAIYPTCLWRGFMSMMGAAIVGVAAWLLAVAGLIFNFLVDYTIVGFASHVYQPIQSGIETGWQAFRDLSNIVVIGMFTFIAISMILGVESFGSRRMVARVLIIAVLINFSLLFTKLIIDSSHFIATEFYKASLAQVSGGTASSIPGTSDASGVNPFGSFATKGIAGQFIQLTGLTSVYDTAGTLLETSNKVQSGWITLAHALAAATLLLAAAVVLIYGGFLLVARTVIIIFLLITSSLAFASYLIPKLSEGPYGWSAWWKLLINNAIFAPLLLMFIWISLTVGNQLSGSNGTLGSFFNDPTKDVGLNIMFGYLLIVGLLFASIRFANSLSNATGKMVAGFPLAVASRYGVAPVLRATLGRIGHARESVLEGEIDKANKAGRYADAERYRRTLDNSRQRGLARLGKETFNVFDSGPGKLFTRQAGVSSVAGTDGLGKKGFSGYVAERAKAGAEAGKSIKPDMSDETIRKIRDAAAQNVSQWSPENKAGLAQKEEVRDTAATERDKVRRESAGTLEQLQKASQEATQNLSETRRSAAEFKQAIRSNSNGAVADLEKQKIGKNDDERRAINEQIEKEIDSRSRKILERDGLVKAAEKRAKEAAHLVTEEQNKITGAEEAHKRAAEEVETFRTQAQKAAGDAAVKAIEKGFEKASERVASRVALGTVSSTLAHLTGISPEKSLVGSAAIRQMGKVRKSDKLQEVVAALGDNLPKKESEEKTQASGSSTGSENKTDKIS